MSTWISIINDALRNRRRKKKEKKRLFSDLEAAILGEALDWNYEHKNLSDPPGSVNRHYVSIYDTVIGETLVVIQEDETYDIDQGYRNPSNYNYSMIVNEEDRTHRFHGKKVKALFERAKEDHKH